MANDVLNCADVTDCSLNSWDLLFCICNGDGCIPATTSSHVTHDATHDGDDGLVGVYSTTATSASTSPSTGGGAGTWSNPSGALTDDGTITDPVIGTFIDSGSFASVNLEHATSPGSGCPKGSQYLVLTGYGFAIPDGATIVGIVVGIKWVGVAPTNEIDTYNIALTLGGTLYYLADPRGDGCTSSYRSSSPYPPGGLFGGFIPGWPYTQNGGSWFCGPDSTGSAGVRVMPLGGDTLNVSFDSPVHFGNMPGCADPDPVDSVFLGPVEKDIAISTLKQSWLPSDVNDPSFGVAASFCNTLLSGSPLQLNVYAMGIGIYYTGGLVKRRPNVCVNT